MSTRTVLFRLAHPLRSLPAAFAFAALAVIGSARANAATPSGDITVSAPTVKDVGTDSLTGATIEKWTVTARVAFDPLTLSTVSGTAELRERVLEAASQACRAALTDDYEKCVLETVQAAQPQVDKAVARSKGGSPS